MNPGTSILNVSCLLNDLYHHSHIVLLAIHFSLKGLPAQHALTNQAKLINPGTPSLTHNESALGLKAKPKHCFELSTCFVNFGLHKPL